MEILTKGELIHWLKCSITMLIFGYGRCFPSSVDGPANCKCTKLIFSTENAIPLGDPLYNDTYGDFFLYGSYGGYPVYQKADGSQYIYFLKGAWIITGWIGLDTRRHQNFMDQQEGEFCPYRYKFCAVSRGPIKDCGQSYRSPTSWQYYDQTQAGFQMVHDLSAKLTCPEEPCKCGFQAECVSNRHCQCKAGYRGDPFTRCFPTTSLPATCLCGELQLTMSESGPAGKAFGDVIGSYFHYGSHNGRPVYQHRTGGLYLFLLSKDGNRMWALSHKIGEDNISLGTLAINLCPYKEAGPWVYYSKERKEFVIDNSIRLTCKGQTPTRALSGNSCALKWGKPVFLGRSLRLRPNR